MLSDWKGPQSLRESRQKNRRRFADRLYKHVYRSTAFSPLPVIALGFLGIILLGSLLLTLPAASASGVRVPWFDTLFTATSAVCVTGLVVVDTGTVYSGFGHVVLLVLIQLGGLGFMTFATLIFQMMGRHISMRERMIMCDSMNEDDIGGVVRLVRWVALSAFTVELTGALLFAIRLIPIYGPGKGAFYALFNHWSLARMELDKNSCVSCGKCMRACPMQVDVLKNINSAECIRCGECAKSCPTGAISLTAGKITLKKNVV